MHSRVEIQKVCSVTCTAVALGEGPGGARLRASGWRKCCCLVTGTPRVFGYVHLGSLVMLGYVHLAPDGIYVEMLPCARCSVTCTRVVSPTFVLSVAFFCLRTNGSIACSDYVGFSNRARHEQHHRGDNAGFASLQARQTTGAEEAEPPLCEEGFDLHFINTAGGIANAPLMVNEFVPTACLRRDASRGPSARRA